MDTTKFRSLFPAALTGGILGDSVLDLYLSQTQNPASSYKMEENDNGWTIEIPLAGVSKKNIKTKISENDNLVVEISESSKWYGGLVKKFKLSPSCDSENLTAKYSDGVLTLTIPKKESFRERLIEVK